jgi:hypothetical protein
MMAYSQSQRHIILYVSLLALLLIAGAMLGQSSCSTTLPGVAISSPPAGQLTTCKPVFEAQFTNIPSEGILYIVAKIDGVQIKADGVYTIGSGSITVSEYSVTNEKLHFVAYGFTTGDHTFSVQAGSGNAITLQSVIFSASNLLTVVVEMTSGDIPYCVPCAAGDYSCQAKNLCEALTKTTCVRQNYDCYTGSQGSWYPSGTPGGSDFNFAYTYDLMGNYGNICDCDPNHTDRYGIARKHQYCGVGRWYRK